MHVRFCVTQSAAADIPHAKFGSRGGVEYGFMWCTADRSVALGYAAQGSGLYGTVLEASAVKTRTGPITLPGAKLRGWVSGAVGGKVGGWVGGWVGRWVAASKMWLQG